eukprot:752884-Hanusia_phi.AAC.1
MALDNYTSAAHVAESEYSTFVGSIVAEVSSTPYEMINSNWSAAQPITESLPHTMVRVPENTSLDHNISDGFFFQTSNIGFTPNPQNSIFSGTCTTCPDYFVQFMTCMCTSCCQSIKDYFDNTIFPQSNFLNMTCMNATCSYVPPSTPIPSPGGLSPALQAQADTASAIVGTCFLTGDLSVYSRIVYAATVVAASVAGAVAASVAGTFEKVRNR